MELFDIVKNIFSKNKRSWDSVGKNDKVRNFFMINRIMSIQFPVQANQFNKMRVTPHFVVDWWRDTLSNRFSKPPVDHKTFLFSYLSTSTDLFYELFI